MNEKDFLTNIKPYLNASAADLSAAQASRLADARQKALAAYREPVRLLGLVTVSGQVRDPAYLVRQPLFWLPILAIAAAVWFAQPASPEDLYDNAGVIDAKLLTGELPIDAFLDKDFAEWVKEKEADQAPR
ncbi:MAG: DUF3619 family protein [Burkholderiales bacterium]|jgi:hypothetical protein|nr:DUF3619 family protein [Nitrosomonadaceae bacterium]